MFFKSPQGTFEKVGGKMVEQLSFFNENNKVNNQKKVKFIRDVFNLCEDFKMNSVFNLHMEIQNHFIILHNGIYYHTYKENCILI